LTGAICNRDLCKGDFYERQATNKLYERLVQEGYKVKKITFPNYDNDVSPYVASTFYAVDRFASYRTEWGQAYNDGWIILADRYTTSNMVHQAAKIKDMEEKDRFRDISGHAPLFQQGAYERKGKQIYRGAEKRYT